MSDNKKLSHWPVVLIVLVIGAVFIFSLFTYQVNTTENAVVLRFGKPVLERDTSPGLHFKWPVESIWRIDNRIHCFEGNIGALEEVFTSDGKNIIVGLYLGWRVSQENSIRFLERIKHTALAEEELTTLLRSYKSGIFGKYKFGNLINIDKSQIKIDRIEEELLELVKRDAGQLYGIDVRFLGVKHIGLPESVIGKVFDRMKVERENEAQRIVSEGESGAVRIRAEADKESAKLFAEAESKAKFLRAEGDAKAAKNYSVFQKNPKLASFLRKLDSIKKTLTDKSVLILDTNTVPYDLLRSESLDELDLGQE